jgi:hypothetical protein
MSGLNHFPAKEESVERWAVGSNPTCSSTYYFLFYQFVVEYKFNVNYERNENGSNYNVSNSCFGRTEAS